MGNALDLQIILVQLQLKTYKEILNSIILYKLIKEPKIMQINQGNNNKTRQEQQVQVLEIVLLQMIEHSQK